MTTCSRDYGRRADPNHFPFSIPSLHTHEQASLRKQTYTQYVTMPLVWERINVKVSPPNKNIVFFEPIPGSGEAMSREVSLWRSRVMSGSVSLGKCWLENVAQFLEKHHLAVTSRNLEEYEPNRVFWDRNFNNGGMLELPSPFKEASANYSVNLLKRSYSSSSTPSPPIVCNRQRVQVSRTGPLS